MASCPTRDGRETLLKFFNVIIAQRRKFLVIYLNPLRKQFVQTTIELSGIGGVFGSASFVVGGGGVDVIEVAYPTESRLESRLESHLDSQLESDLESNLESHLESHPESHLESRVWNPRSEKPAAFKKGLMFSKRV